MGRFRIREENELKTEEEEGSKAVTEDVSEKNSAETKRKRDSKSDEEESDGSDLDIDPYPKDMSEELKNEIKRYSRTLNTAGPYKIDFIPKHIGFMGCVIPMDPIKDDDVYGKAQIFIQLAIDQYHKGEGKDSNLVLNNIMRVNRRSAGGAFRYYITFEATNTKSGEKDVYCTKVLDDLVEKVRSVENFFKEGEGNEQEDLPITVWLV